jgi:aspartate carbamoyltransferase catalytic subunit
MPRGVEQWPVESLLDLDEALAAAPDAVMMLRVQKERIRGDFFPSSKEYIKNYALTRDRASRLPDHAVVMHPGPMNRGVEIESDVADSHRSVVLQQVRNGVSVRMAALFEVWGEK